MFTVYTHRLGNNLLPYSFDGDPAPDLPGPNCAPALANELPKGYLSVLPAGCSPGELAAEPFDDLVVEGFAS